MTDFDQASAQPKSWWTIKRIAVIGILGIFAIIFISGIIGFGNDTVDLQNRRKQKDDERTAFYDKMWKTLAQKSQIALRNDSSFSRNVDAIMAGRKDAPQLFMKWVQESNPNANYEAVSALYADLSRAVEAQRDGFFVQEKMIQGIVLEYNNRIQKFPGSFYNLFYGRKKMEYKPITSTRTDNVIETGKDDDVKLFE
jgi:hypothetical protein